METRKIIGFGKNSFVISLPKIWVSENKLKKGDSVYVSDEQNELRIASRDIKKRKEIKKIIINTKNKGKKEIRTEIVSAYLNNYNEIEITGLPADYMTVIKATILNLTGLEIMEQSSDKIKVQDLLDEADVSIRNLVRRIDFTIRSMIDDSIECIKKDHYDAIFQRDIDINRLVFLSYRVMRAGLEDMNFAKTIGLSQIDILTNWMILMRLEKIGDQTKRIARFLKKVNLRKSSADGLKSLYKRVKDDYVSVMKTYYTHDKEVALKKAVMSWKEIEACDAFLKKNNRVEMMAITENLKSMISSIKHIARSVVSAN